MRVPLILFFLVVVVTANQDFVNENSKIEELQQYVVNDAAPGSVLTTNWGLRLNNTDDSLKAGPRGPTLLEDFHFREKMMHFDHERIPERVVHARGAAAHGYFVAEEDLSDLTRADFLCKPGKKTPIFLRFSTVLGSRGAADTARDVRGFAIKFYTDEGNFDLVGNNIPVFFIQDAIKFPDLIHAGKPEPNNEIPQAQTAHDNFWDFASLTTETAHMLQWVMSDRAIPRSFRMMQGFGVHSFVLYNRQGIRRFVKFHLTPIDLGVNSLVWDEAQKLAGVDPDFHRRDLYDNIEAGNYPEWDVSIQVLAESDENNFDFDILDATKLIPEDLIPRRRIGRIVLNRNPDNYFAETEQVAFHTGHLVPGIAVSNDPLLQGRMFSYFDTQLTRLGGPNFEEIPINRPLCPFKNNQRDGFHRMTINSAKVNYYPNRFGFPAVVSENQGGYVTPPTPVNGTKIRARGPKFAEHYNQARKFFISLVDWEQEHVIEAFQFELSHVMDLGVRVKMIDLLNHVDHTLAQRVAQAIGVAPPTVVRHNPAITPSPYLSQTAFPARTIKTRRVAFLVGPGFNGAQAQGLALFLKSQGAQPVYIGPHLGTVADSSGVMTTMQATWFNTRSVQYDAVVIVGGTYSVDHLDVSGRVIAFVNEAFKHGKPIIALAEGVQLLESLHWPGIKFVAPNQVLVVSSEGVVTSNDICSSLYDEVFRAILAHRFPYRNTKSVPA